MKEWMVNFSVGQHTRNRVNLTCGVDCGARATLWQVLILMCQLPPSLIDLQHRVSPRTGRISHVVKEVR